jgi:hypothetical protein
MPITTDEYYDLPWWFGLVNWGIPIFLALTSATWFALCLTGMFAWPSVLNALSWTPSMIEVMDSLYAFGLITMGMISVGSMVGFCSAVCIRGLFLLNVVQNLVTSLSKKCIEAIEGRKVDKYHYDKELIQLAKGVKQLKEQKQDAEQRCHRLEVHLEIANQRETVSNITPMHQQALSAAIKSRSEAQGADDLTKEASSQSPAP